MNKLFLPAVTLLMLCCTSALAASSEKIKAVTCEGEVGSAHTLIVGNCSFTGRPAGQVWAKCKEDSLCRVQAYGWDNGQGIFIINRVESVELQSQPKSAASAQNNSYYYVANTRPPDAFLALRTHPTSRQGMRVKEMPNGTLLQTLQRRDDGWWYVRVVPSGEEGWTLSGQGNRKWIECCTTFDPNTDSIAITRQELDRKVSAHTNVLSVIETETRKFISELRCKSMDYRLKQLSSQNGFEISINCDFQNNGDSGESSVSLIYKLDASGRMVLIDKTYAG